MVLMSSHLKSILMRINSTWVGSIVLVAIIGISLWGCKKEQNVVPETPNSNGTNNGINQGPNDSSKTNGPTPYQVKIPVGFPALSAHPENPLTVEGIALGRKLYYDPLLSQGGPLSGMSCSGCHDQKTSFTVSGGPVAILPHVNLAWNSKFLWNGKIEGGLEDIMAFEVDDFFKSDMKVLAASSEYQKLYNNAFGSTEINSRRTAFALAQFFTTLISGNSKFDLYLQKRRTFTNLERVGYDLFNSETGDCFHCHGYPLMTDNAFHNIGLDSTFSGPNLGRYLISQVESDKGAFKSPTLRNIALTAPYMHDNRFNTLEEVVEHYDSGVKKSASLDPLLKKGNRVNGLKLSSFQKEALVAYLKTLTDTEFISNPELAKP